MGVLAGSSAPPPPPAVPAGLVTGVDTRKLEVAAARFFSDPALGRTHALLVLHHGQIVAERYGPGLGPDSRFISWSMAKSVTATLLGRLVSDGRLTLDAPAPVPAWQRPGDPRAAITTGQLLHMSAGLDHRESGPPYRSAQTIRMLFTDQTDDAAAFAAAQPLAAAPGSRFVYSSASSMILADIITRTVTSESDAARRRAAVRTWMDDVLFRPAGLSSFIVEFDAAGTFLGGSFMHATARDWARFGALYLGVAPAVVDPAWIAVVRAPSALDPGFGGHFWKNSPRPAGSAPALFPARGPAGLIAAIGHLGQYVLISPDQALVVVRLGRTLDEDLQPVRESLADLVALFPEGAP